MNKMKTLLFAMSVMLIAVPVVAGNIDFRSAYKHATKEYDHRIKIGSSSQLNGQGSLYYSVEMTFQSEGDENGDEGFWSDLSRGDAEFDWGYRYSLNENWYIIPGMPITFGDDKVTYKPQLRVEYKADMGLTTALRYRYEFQQYSSDSGEDDTEQSKITFTGCYDFESNKNFKLGYEANYAKNHDGIALYDNDDWEWDAGLIMGYQLGNWRPYIEFWSIGQNSTTSDRQLRTRIGLNYTF
jgi:hypothetical protein